MGSLNIDIKFLSDTAQMPTKAYPSDAGFDLCADIPDRVEIQPHSVEKINTGIALAIPEGYFGGIYARSGLATKHGLRPANATGVIDSMYRGPLIVALYNDSDETQMIYPGDRIAQLVIHPIPEVTLNKVDELSTTERNDGGFGSTGV